MVEQRIESRDVELLDKGSGSKTGQVIHVKAETILVGNFVDDLRGLVNVSLTCPY